MGTTVLPRMEDLLSLHGMKARMSMEMLSSSSSISLLLQVRDLNSSSLRFDSEGKVKADGKSKKMEGVMFG
jgi:hypothetical protein